MSDAQKLMDCLIAFDKAIKDIDDKLNRAVADFQQHQQEAERQSSHQD